MKKNLKCWSAITVATVFINAGVFAQDSEAPSAASGTKSGTTSEAKAKSSSGVSHVSGKVVIGASGGGGGFGSAGFGSTGGGGEFGGGGFGGAGIGGGGYGGGMGGISSGQNGYGMELIMPTGLGTQAGRPLIIRSSPLESKNEAMLEEDMAIMARILEKALDKKSGDATILKAMNINIQSIGSPRTFRSIYLEDYGVVFMLNVRFPLVPSSTVAPEKAKPETNSAWEQTKQEIYGPRFQAQPGMLFGDKQAPVEEYDEQKVAKLKNDVLGALKNAANIRALKSDEYITVVITGGQRTSGNSARPQVYQIRRNFSDPNMKSDTMSVGVVSAASSQGEGETEITIRAKKSDVSDFAKGTTTLDEFRKKAAITIY